MAQRSGIFLNRVDIIVCGHMSILVLISVRHYLGSLMVRICT